MLDTNQQVTVNKKYKDRLFIFIFANEEHKDWMLSLYNAVNKSHYEDSNEIKYNTIGSHLFMGMKNDASFLIGSEMNVYEHQSSYNPNMPLRQLQYVGTLYEGYVTEHNKNKYGSTQVMLPVPRLVCFYNGMDPKEDEVILKLESAFNEKERDKADITVQVRMLNINYGRNPDLLQLCKPLEEYSWIVDRIRIEYNDCKDLEKAVNAMIDAIPDDFILRPFLIKHRNEVYTMLIEEYDETKVHNLFKAEGVQIGEQNTLVIMDRLMSGETVEELIQAGFKAETVKSVYDRIQTLQPSK